MDLLAFIVGIVYGAVLADNTFNLRKLKGWMLLFEKKEKVK